MKKVLKKFNRTLSIMLAAAMVLTMVPQTAMPVLAAENEVVEEASEASEVTDVTPADEDNESTDVKDTGVEPENPTDDEQNNEEGGNTEETPGDNDTPVIETPDTETPEESPEDPAEPSEEEVVEPTTDTLDGATVDANGDSHAVTKAEGEGTTITLSAETATEGTDYTFTAALKDNYKDLVVTYKVKDAEGNWGGAKNDATESEGSYTISGANITGDIEISATATKITYNVTAAFTADDVAFTCDALSEGSTSGTINAGEDLSFTATIKDADTKEITKVSYTIGGSETKLELVSSGQYTVSADQITGDIAITVTSAAIPTYDITFGSHANIAKVTDIQVNGEPATDILGESDWKINAKKGSTVSFKLEPDAKFQVEKVADADDTEIKAANGVYTITDLSDNVTLSITTGLTSAANGFSFAMDTGSDRQSATMTVALPAGAADVDTDKGLTTITGEYIAGKSALTLNEKIIVSFAAKEGYTLGDVKVGGEKVEPTTAAGEEDGTPAKYEITLEAGKSKAITVATDVVGSEGEKYFTINKNSADHMTLGEVKADDTAITPAADGEHKGQYLAATGKKRVTFSITADGAYEPIVTAVTKASGEGAEDTTVELEADEVKTVSGKTTYSYMILAAKLADEYTITEVQSKKALTFTGVENVDVSIDGKLVSPDKLADAENPLEYVQGTKLTVKVAAKANTTLKSVKYQVGGANETAAKITNNVSEFFLTLTDNTVVTIDAAGELVALPLKEEGEALSPVKGVYNVSYTGAYTAAIGEGAEQNLVKPEAATLVDKSKKEIASATGKGAVVSIQNDKTVKIDLGNADATAVSGQKLTLTLTVGTGDAAKNFTYTLQATKAITAAGDITVAANAKQPTDTVKSYALKTKGEIGKIQVKAEETDVTAGYLAKQPEIDTKKGMLVIAAGKVPTPDDGVKITVYAGEGDNAISKTVVLKTTALITENTAAPKVTLKNATDLGFTLAVSAKTDQDVPANSLYYKVTATPKTGLTADDKLKTDPTVIYVPKTADSQDIQVRVGKDDAQDGTGKAWEYTVTVSLLHAKTTNTEPTTDALTQAASKEFKTPDNKPFATQNPAWEANLKLKKGKTTIYTGESDVAIATPQFTKTTTYTKLDASSVTDLTQTDGHGLEFKVEDGVIKASASADTTVGKHTVQVVALADNAVGGHDMVASKATIVVTVVKGINELDVSIPATSMYKAVNKAATLKATVIYNEDQSGKDKTRQPKTKKVNWEVVKYAENHDDINDDVVFGDGKVKIKNGTVTVAKDYVIKANSEENKFQIRVTVANTDKATIGDADAAYSRPIEITNEGLDMGKLVIVDQNNKVLAISGESKPKTEEKLEASDLENATIKIVNTNASVTKGETYSVDAGKEVASANLAYKSSKAKDVSIDAVGVITVVKANTKPVLTVTANDGSKKSLAIKLNVGYDTPAGDLALQITDSDNNAIYDPTTDGITVAKNYAGSATNVLETRLMQKGENGAWAAAEAYVNYDIKVIGGKKVEQKGSGATITTDKKEVKIELTDKAKNVKTTYTLTNTGFVSSGVKVKAKVIGSLKQKATSAEQQVKLELEIPEEFAASLTDNTKAAAVMVDVDWSKATVKNAEDLVTFSDSLQDKVYTISNYDSKTKKATVDLTFTGNAKYNQKSYVLKVSVGSKAVSDNAFTAAAPAVAATVKAEKTKKFTFKPTTSYTIATRDGGAVISGKASIPTDDMKLTELKLLNANFGGKANDFTKYFKIDGQKLMLNDGLSATDIANLAKKEYKNQLTGFLSYNAGTQKSYYELSTGTGANTVKITVKLNDSKTVAKYTVDGKPEISNKANATTSVQILANKAPVTIAHAAFDTTSSKTDACIDTENAATLVADGKISLKLKETVAANKTKIKATVYVIPAESFYLGEFVEGKNPTVDTYKKYGAAVTINLTVKQPVTMTLEQAKAAVMGWVAEVNAADPAPAWLSGETDDAVKNSIVAEAGKAIIADNAADFTVAFANKTGSSDPDFNRVAASETQDGSVSGTLQITLGESSETVAFAFTIPKTGGTTPPEEATVEKVEIKKDNAVITTDTIQAGSAAVTYTAEVTGQNLIAGTDDQVTWTLDGYSGSTSTLADGVLTVGAGEKEKTLTVKATSTKDTTKSATVTVTVTAADSTS